MCTCLLVPTYTYSMSVLDSPVHIHVPILRLRVYFHSRTYPSRYCAPFSYDRYRKYTKPQVTLLPSVVHQTRYKTKACEGKDDNEGFRGLYRNYPDTPKLAL